MNDQKFRSIIVSADAGAFLSLSESDKEDFMLTLMYDFIFRKKLPEMNEVQKTLYLAARLEEYLSGRLASLPFRGRGTVESPA